MAGLPRKDHQENTTPEVASPVEGEPQQPDSWQRYVARLNAAGIPEPGKWQDPRRKRATMADEQALYEVGPSLVDRLPWVEYLQDDGCMLLDDGESVAAFFELVPIGTEGRDARWFDGVRDTIENALQDSFEELEDRPWVVQFYVQDETGWDSYLQTLKGYVHPRAEGSAFTQFYLHSFERHLRDISKPGGLFKDNTVTQLPWRGQTRRVRMVVYRWVTREHRAGTDRAVSTGRTAGTSRAAATALRGGELPKDALATACDRLVRGLSNAGVKAQRLGAADTHEWLLRWFNPHPTMLGSSAEARERFYRLAAYPQEPEAGELELASGTDFAQRLFFGQPRSDAEKGLWYFDAMPHRVVVLDRLRMPPTIGHLTGETRTSGNAVNALFDQTPEGTVMCITLVVTPQDTLEGHLHYLGKKSIGETIASDQTRQDLEQARSIVGESHKLYRGSVAFYLRGQNLNELNARTRQLNNVMLSAGLQPVREEDEVAPLNSYLRWLPCVYNPAKDKRQWYTQFLFAQHVANLSPIWGRSQGTGHPGITLFHRGGGAVSFDPLNRLDRQMNAHLFLFGPTGSGKSATLLNMLIQVTALYRPRVFLVEAGNSFGLFGQFAERMGLTVHQVKLAPGAGVTLAPFADAWRLVNTPGNVQTLDADAVDEPAESQGPPTEADQQRDILGELEITARLMITGGEDKEEARMTRADRSLIRQCILDAARRSIPEKRTVLTQDVRDALRERGRDPLLPEMRRTRLLEMADAMDMFCQGVDGEMFNTPGTPWPEADITIVDLATFAREGYHSQLSISYISLINTVNNIAERDQFLGRPIICATDEGHIITKNPLTAPFVLKITKMWRKLGAWFWLATQNLADLPKAAEPMLNMIEWWICLSMPPDEVEQIARFRELNPAQKALMLSARKEAGKFSEGVILSKSIEVLFRAVPPSLYLALAMTESEEKNERYQLMQQHQIGELDAAFRMAEKIDRARSIEAQPIDADVIEGRI